MKKIFLVLVLSFVVSGLFAQVEQVQQGNFVIDANTTVGGLGGFGSNGTSFLLSTSDGVTIWNVGGEAGYFAMDNLALKLGLGIGDYDGSSIFSYLFGAKYYVIGNIPFQLDFSGQSGEDFYGDESPFYIGLQGGYAIFLGDMVSLEPGLRYKISTNDVFDNVFQIQMGFSIFF